MLTVYTCIVSEHDLRLVALAALVCAIAAFSAVNLLQHVARSTGRARAFWLMLAAASTGFGIWATHFIAMLAFSPDIPTGYHAGLTTLSLAAAIAVTGIGMYIATLPGGGRRHLVGGAVIGSGIAIMHYTGMAAFEVQGRIEWDVAAVLTSVAVGVVLAALAILVALRSRSLLANLASAVLMTLAICSHHFIAMSAVSIFPDMTTAISPSSIHATSLALIVAAGSLAILVMSGVAIWVDLRFRRASQEAARMLGLANAAVEGLVICDGPRVVRVNDSTLSLTGFPNEAMEGALLSDLFLTGIDQALLSRPAPRAQEAQLKTADGSGIPVEIIAREIDYCGKPHTVIAIRDVRERKKAEAEIMRLAHFDPLTGLPNRRNFSEKLETEMTGIDHGSHRMALVLIDLDRFKEVNDMFGHGVGDAVLQRVARAVSALLEPGQMMARLGGDEFAVILPGLSDVGAAGRFAELALKALRDENAHADIVGLVSASMGIAFYPVDAQDPTTLITHADTALYRAKKEGKDTYCFFETAMGAKAHERRVMELDLRQAVQRGEFRLVYQPQQEIRSGKVLGFEALLRWDHPTRGLILPTVFIPMAEDSGSIMQIDEWVLATACAEAAQWPMPLTIAINVSAVQLHSQNFVRIVHETLLRTGLAPKRLEIEVTETALIKDMQRALATLRQVKALGVNVAIDDFGTGNSSLSNLRAFPFDKIKIDGSFIKSVDKNREVAAIVRAVLGLGRGLGLPVLAEGVETSHELEFLDAEACQIGQGYYLGEPSPIETFADLTGRLDLLTQPGADVVTKARVAS